MSPTLTALIALQQLDTAAEAARRQVADMPATERDIDAGIASAKAVVESAKAQLADNQKARRELEKELAQVDTRLARFDDHKAAVKTNQEFTALLHEISTAKAEKDRVEEQILVLLEAADGVAMAIKNAERALADVSRQGNEARAVLGAQRQRLEGELTRLATERNRVAAGVAPPVLAKYDQILKQRRMLAVAEIDGERCTACHVRMRPAVAQQVRRSEDIVQCDSCQRILYFVPKEPATTAHRP